MPIKIDPFIAKNTKLWKELEIKHPGKSEKFLLEAFQEESTKRRVERGSIWTGRATEDE